MSKVEEQLCDLIRKRAEVGQAKYGTTMERTDLSLLDWHRHHLEELLDAAVYVMKKIDMLEASET